VTTICCLDLTFFHGSSRGIGSENTLIHC